MGTTTTARTLFGLLMGLTAATLGACSSGGGDDGGGDDGTPLDPMALLDDIEDGDGAIEEIDGRYGSWFSYNDDAANKSQVPSPDSDFVGTEGGANGSMFAAASKGEGYKVWGAGFGFDLNNTGEGGPLGEGEKKAWDASKYTGLRLMAKGNVPLRVGILVSEAVEVDAGGGCTPPPPPAEGEEEAPGCGDSFGKTLSLTGEWKEYRLDFTSLKQDGWGIKATWDAKTVTSVMFDVEADQKFDVAVDDLSFF